MTPAVRRHDDAAALTVAVASALLERIADAQARGEVPHVCLTGGSIAGAIHRELGRRGSETAVDWSRVVFWWGDERFVEASSSDRNARQARLAWLDQVGVPASHIHEIPAAARGVSAEDAAAAYSEEMRTHGAGFFEVCMLGVGPDGHVASLFPGHGALDVVGEIAMAVRDSPKPPPERVTLTFEALNRSRAVWFLVSGSEKADAVRRALDLADVRQVPAAGVQGEVETIWWLDADAAQ